jgi:23S rRNA pseudouridine1911/1915/1917 synthase
MALFSDVDEVLGSALMTLDVLFEDDHYLAVDKPAGIVVHPTYKHPSGTLLDALRAYAADWPASHNPTIVGRLDRPTSGIVVVAKYAEAHAALQRAAMEKDYLAIVSGEVDEASGEIDWRLRVDPNDRRRVIASRTEGRACLTRFERLVQGDGVALLRCRLETGRRHQIRAHLAAQGWPLVGDTIYNLQIPIYKADRVALHAWRVAFTHPFNGAPVAIEAPPPEDFRRIMQACGLDVTLQSSQELHHGGHREHGGQIVRKD